MPVLVPAAFFATTGQYAKKVKPFTFQVGMLPRAGSAWIATLLNMHPGVFCFHDALQSYNGKYAEAPSSKFYYKHVGDCSSYVCATPPVDRSVYVERCQFECCDSLAALNMAKGFGEILDIANAWKADRPIFQFNDIFGPEEEKSLDTLAELFKVIVPGVALDSDKVRFLHPLKVELLDNGPDVFDIETIKWRMN